MAQSSQLAFLNHRLIRNNLLTLHILKASITSLGQVYDNVTLLC